MEKFEKLMLPITFILLIILGWAFLSNSGPSVVPLDSPVENALSSNSKTSFEPKRGDMGAVTVEVTPINPSEYEIVFNTHSVDLGFDFTEIIKLKDDLGNAYDAKTWSGERGGHHLQGTVAFPKVDTQANSVTITISDIENEVLSFEWSL